METDSRTIKVQLDADPRFAAAVGGVARYLADSAGVENDAIAQLPAGQRQCIQLWLEDFSYIEIGKALRISLDAVRSRLRGAPAVARLTAPVWSEANWRPNPLN